MLTIDEIAMLIGYCVMAGIGTFVAGMLLCSGLTKLFWHGGQEAFAFLRYLHWIAQGRKRAPEKGGSDDNQD